VTKRKPAAQTYAVEIPGMLADYLAATPAAGLLSAGEHQRKGRGSLLRLSASADDLVELYAAAEPLGMHGFESSDHERRALRQFTERLQDAGVFDDPSVRGRYPQLRTGEARPVGGPRRPSTGDPVSSDDMPDQPPPSGISRKGTAAKPAKASTNTVADTLIPAGRGFRSPVVNSRGPIVVAPMNQPSGWSRRPVLDPRAEMRGRALRASQYLWDAVRQMADDKGVNVSDEIREALMDRLRAHGVDVNEIVANEEAGRV